MKVKKNYIVEWISAIASETCFIMFEFLFSLTYFKSSETHVFKNIILLLILSICCKVFQLYYLS